MTNAESNRSRSARSPELEETLMGLLKFSVAKLLANVCCLIVSAVAQDPNATTPSPISEKPLDGVSLRQRAQQRDAKAAYLVGRSYMTGSGVPQDSREAARWFRDAATQDLADAQFLLGFLYELGDGVAQDYKTALSYYSAAAKQGHATAQNNLAVMYELGRGTGRNVHEAENWYRAAAEQLVDTAQCNLASLEFRKKDYQQAVVWFRAAAQRGNAIAQENLAWMYYTGTGVPLDYFEAAKWARLAAEEGLSRAQLDLGFLYEQGKGVPQDYVSAFVWYKAAQDGGQKRARVQLKSLSRVMTHEQLSASMGGVASVPRSSSSMDETEGSIGAPFADPRVKGADVRRQINPQVRLP